MNSQTFISIETDELELSCPYCDSEIDRIRIRYRRGITATCETCENDYSISISLDQA